MFTFDKSGFQLDISGSLRPLAAIIPLSMYFVFLLYVSKINGKVTERYKLAFQR